MFRKLIVGLVVLLAFVAATPGQAAQGFYVGTGLGLGIPNQDGDIIDAVDPQAAFAWELIHLGYNFSDMWGINMQWGTAVGNTDWDPDNDLMWGQDYLTFCLRYTIAGNDFEPYIEAGPGIYTYSLLADDWVGVSDPALGARIALGGNFNLGNLYLAPELSYHIANYDEMEIEDEVYPDGTIDFEERGNMLLLLFKIGYQSNH